MGEEEVPLAGEAVQPAPRVPRSWLRRRAALAVLIVAAATWLYLAPGFARPHLAALTALLVASEVHASGSASEWDVIWPSGVHIRAGKSIYTESIGVKQEHERVSGWRDGNWVKLTHNAGFMLIRNGDHLLLKAAPVSTTTPKTSTTHPATTTSTLTARTDLAEKAVGRHEWEVISDQPVRTHMSTGAPVMELKPKGSLVVGSQEGAWLRLTRQRGFMHLPNGSTLKLRPVTYFTASHSCAEDGRFAISDIAACEAAATALGLEGARAQLAPTSPHKEAGCFVNGSGALFFSLKVGEASTRGHQDSLCSSKRYPVLVATLPEITTSLQPIDPHAPRPLLFCWCVAMVELELMRHIYAKHSGLFACHRWTVFSDGMHPLGPGASTVAIPGPLSKRGRIPHIPQYKMLLNTDVFFRAWDKVLTGGLYREFEWTVKLDPDCVFFPDRLRKHLRTGNYNPAESIYFKNCQQWGSMQGPVELFSQAAMETLRARVGECKHSINRTGIGEDMFMQRCTQQLGIQPREDWSLLKDEYCLHHKEPCTDGWVVGFHPYKSIREFDMCLGEALER